MNDVSAVSRLPVMRARSLLVPVAVLRSPPPAADPTDVFTATRASLPISPARASVDWQGAVQRLQASVDSDLALQKSPGPDGLHLRPHSESMFMPQPAPGARGTVVMLHSYTGGAWQYPELAQRFFDAGYNVYVPRLPGHGLADAAGMPTGVSIPRSDQDERWENFVDSTFDNLKALGSPVFAVGLSGGANLALRMAAKHDLKGVVAMAPYLGGNLPKAFIFPVFNALDAITLGWFGKLLDRCPWNHNVPVPDDPRPDTQGSTGQAMAMEQVGRRVHSVPCPIQCLTVQGDFLSGAQEVSALLRHSGSAVPHGWYRFHKDEGVPHAMVSPAQNTAPGKAQKVHDIVFDFVDQGRTVDRK